MAEKSGTTSLTAAILGIIIGIIFLIFGISILAGDSDVKKNCTEKTNGILLGTTQRYRRHYDRRKITGREYYYTATIKYEVDGVEYILKTESKHNDFSANQVVCYDPDDPKEAYVKNDVKENYKSSLTYFLFGAFFTVVSVLQIRNYLKKKNGEFLDTSDRQFDFSQ